jgi:PKD repeat protein
LILGAESLKTYFYPSMGLDKSLSIKVIKNYLGFAFDKINNKIYFSSDTSFGFIQLNQESFKAKAAFFINQTTLHVGDILQITNLSKNYDVVKWILPDGSESNEINPKFVIYKEGTYNFKLIVWNEFSQDTLIKSINISVIPQIIADFTSDIVSGSVPLTVYFNNLSIGNIENYKWNFGDGEYSEEENPAHTYEFEGRYTVELLVKDSIGSSIAIKNNFIWVHTIITDTTKTDTTKKDSATIVKGVLYPNPAKDFLNINLEDSFKDAKWEVFDMYGNKINEGIIIKPNEFKIDIRNLSNAMYFLRINNKGNFKTFKFIRY